MDTVDIEKNFLTDVEEKKLYEVEDVIGDCIREILTSDDTMEYIKSKVESLGFKVKLPEDVTLEECFDTDIDEMCCTLVRSGSIIDGVEHNSYRHKIESHRKFFKQ